MIVILLIIISKENSSIFLISLFLPFSRQLVPLACFQDPPPLPLEGHEGEIVRAFGSVDKGEWVEGYIGEGGKHDGSFVPNPEKISVYIYWNVSRFDSTFELNPRPANKFIYFS